MIVLLSVVEALKYFIYTAENAASLYFFTYSQVGGGRLGSGP